MKKLNRFTGILAASLLFAGCTNALSSLRQSSGAADAENVVCTVTGNIILGSAMPSELADAIKTAESNTKSATNARSAGTSFTEAANPDKLQTNFIMVSAMKDGLPGTEVLVTAEKDEATGNLSYSVPISSYGTWQLRVYWSAITDDTEDQVREILDNYSAYETITVTKASTPETIKKDLTTYPDFYEDICGSISLSVKTDILKKYVDENTTPGYVSELSITKVIWKWLPEETSSTNESVKNWFTSMNKGDLDVTNTAADFEATEDAETLLNSGEEQGHTYKDYLKDYATTFNFTNVPAGCHKVRISFIEEDDGEERVAYSCDEIITVYSGFVTDTWYGNSDHFRTKDGVTDFYVSEHDEKEALIHYNEATTVKIPYILWNGEDNQYFSTGYEEGNVLKDSTEHRAGNHIFSSITGYEEIPDDDDDLYFNAGRNFTFGGSNIFYINNDNLLFRFTNSYAGLKPDNTFSIELEGKLRDSIDNPTDFDYFCVNSFCYSNDTIYFSWQYMDSSNQQHYYITRYNMKNATYLNTTTTNKYLKIAVKEESDGTSGTLFYVKDTSTGSGSPQYVLCKNTFTITDTLTLTEAGATYEMTASNYGFYLYGTMEITDMMIQSDTINNTKVEYLYVLVAAYSNPSKFLYTKSGNEGEETYTESRQIFSSNGGVLKFDASTGAQVKWKNGKYILGWYTIQNSSYYSSYYNGSTDVYSSLTTETEITTCPPNTTEAKNYFYGAQKFVAIKEKELVIADEGAYTEATDTSCDTYNTVSDKNRVVVVNLENESISATDVDFTFSKYLDASGGLVVTGF